MGGMPPVPGHRARPADPPRVNDYDVLAEAYTAENETSHPDEAERRTEID